MNCNQEDAAPSKIIRWISLSLLVGVIIYIGLFLSARYWAPSSADGPGEGFVNTFAPISRVAAAKPGYWEAAVENGGQLKVFIENVNLGNGYVYFTYLGNEYRCYGGGSLDSRHDMTYQVLQFTGEISTDDAFDSQLQVTAAIAQMSPKK